MARLGSIITVRCSDKTCLGGEKYVQTGEEITCPKCEKPATRFVEGAKTGCGTTIYSESLGVTPGQVDEAKRRFPHHNFLPDGRMVLKGPAERRQVIKDLGFDRE